MAHKRGKHPIGENIREIIFGIQDGAIGNLAVVVGLAQAAAANKIIILGGLATMLAQSISMSTGTYLSIKSEKEYFIAGRRKERAFGREYAKHKNPLFSAVIMAVSVTIGTSIPLLPFFYFQGMEGIYPTILITLIALFLVGANKAKLTKRNWFSSGFEMLLIGIAAGAAGLVIGTIFGV